MFDLFDIHEKILIYYIKQITYYPNINNILYVRIVNKSFKKKINYAILNYKELIFKLNNKDFINLKLSDYDNLNLFYRNKLKIKINKYVEFYSNYINLYLILCINDNIYNAYETKMMIYNTIYTIRSRKLIFELLEKEDKNFKKIIDKNIKYELIYEKCKNIKYYYKDINNFKKNINYALGLKN
tara:strand:+ start:178 stop:729 length:552 start_codon:yes stop_codon:yes gene_type:complete